MSDHGYIKFYRGTLTHPFFRDDAERMAWLRLLSAAAWKPYKKRAGEFLVELQRGEVIGAVRYLADEWQWSKGKVERFIKRLQNEGMVETRTGTGITVITICKYNDYQGVDDDGGTPMDREPGQGRDAAGTGPGRGRDAGGDKEEEINNLRTKEIEEMEEGEQESSSSDLTLFGSDQAPEVHKQPPDYEEMFRQWYAVFPKKVDPKDALKCFTRVIKAKEATFDELMDGARRYAVEKANSEKRYIKAPSVWLNKGSWLNEPQAPDAPPQLTLADSTAAGIFEGMQDYE